MLEILKKLLDRGHGRFLAMLSEHIDAELSEQDRAALEAHLQRCDSCTEELESLRATVQLLSRMPEVEAPRSFRLSPAGELVDKPTLAVGASLRTPEPPRERPVFLWAMRVSTALAVVAFTVMVAGNVTGLFDGGGGVGESALDSPAASGPESMDSMMEETTYMMDEPPEAAMAREPDMLPRSTPMLVSEPTAMPESGEAMPEPTATPAPAMMPDPTATPEAMMEESAPEEPTAVAEVEAMEEESEDALKADVATIADAPAPEATTEPSPTATAVPTPIPAPTATPRPSPTATPISTPAPEPTKVPATKSFLSPTVTPFPWSQPDVDVEEEAGGVLFGLTVGLGALAAALVLGTIYLTVRRGRGVD